MIGDAGHEDPGASLGAGIFGTPLMVTSAENNGIVRLTRVRSRFVTAGAGVLLIVCGLITPLTRLLAAIPEPVVGAAGLTIYAVIATMGFGMLSRENLGHGTNGIVVALALCVGHPPPAPLIETSHTAYDDGMTGLSEGTRRRTQGTCASAVSGWLFVLFAMVSCCSITAPAAHASGDRPATVARTITPTHQALARIVVADSPRTGARAAPATDPPSTRPRSCCRARAHPRPFPARPSPLLSPR